MGEGGVAAAGARGEIEEDRGSTAAAAIIDEPGDGSVRYETLQSARFPNRWGRGYHASTVTVIFILTYPTISTVILTVM
uniref:Uncharacterized protein n=1 Tax=Oryza glumipatula TaxID=40148 RepID=A0A0D9Z5T2_9ORYZ